MYALELLTGQRTGEAAARSWADWEPAFLGCLGRLVVGTAYNTRFRLVKTTKTRVEKWVPVHPALAEILERWKAEGWERFYGRAPKPEDLIVPATRGGPRNASHSWRCFRNDLVTLGISHQRHYETRATFISLAEGAGADPETIARITHASLHGAKDLYRRVRLYWPRMCEAVKCIQIPRPREVTPGGGDPGASRDGGDGEPGETGSSAPETGENQGQALAFDSPALPFVPACHRLSRPSARTAAGRRPRRAIDYL